MASYSSTAHTKLFNANDYQIPRKYSRKGNSGFYTINFLEEKYFGLFRV